MTRAEYKNDGFDLSATPIEDVYYHIIVDLESMKVLAMFSSEQGVLDELEKLKNYNEYMTTVLTFRAADIDTPVAFK